MLFSVFDLGKIIIGEFDGSLYIYIRGVREKINFGFAKSAASI